MLRPRKSWMPAEVLCRHPDNIASIILNQALYRGACEQGDVSALDMRLKRWQKCMEYRQAAVHALLVASRLEMVMADARDGVARHDFEAVFRKPVDGVPRIVDGQPGQCWVRCMLIDSHTVVEVLIRRVGNA